MQGSADLPDWSAIDTVLLDMDGTLLDLGYDKRFWEEHLPRRFAESRGVAVEEAHRLMRPIFESTAGTLDWYCIDYWSRALSLDIASLRVFKSCASQAVFVTTKDASPIFSYEFVAPNERSRSRNSIRALPFRKIDGAWMLIY